MVKSFGIENLASFIPPGRVDFAHRAKEWSLSENFLRNKIGVRRVSRKAPHERASDLAMGAFKELFTKAPFNLGELDLIVVVTQNPDTRIPHLSAVLQERIQAPKSCMALDISHGCAGYVYGLSVALGLMRSHGLKKALLFTADPYSEIIDPEDKNTALLFGDAGSVTLISDTPRWVCGESTFYTDGSRAHSIRLENGTLRMDGASVFSFAAKEVPMEIEKLLKKNSLTATNVDLFLLHSGSKFMVETVAARAQIPREKAPIDIEDFGNTVSSSLPILLENQFLSDNRTILLMGFGVGLAVAGTILRKVT